MKGEGKDFFSKVEALLLDAIFEDFDISHSRGIGRDAIMPC